MDNINDLENIVNSNKIRSEVVRQNNIFDLYRFYDEGKDKEYNYGGIYFITRNQDFYCFSRFEHKFVIENVYSAIFNNFNNIFVSVDYDYRIASEKLGVICIQLLSRYYSIIWMPSKINEFQRDKFLEFYESMVQINKKLVNEGFDKIAISVSIIDENENFDLKKIDKVALNIDNYVSDVPINTGEHLLKKYIKRRKTYK